MWTPHCRSRRVRQSWRNQVTDFMRSRNIEEDMTDFAFGCGWTALDCIDSNNNNNNNKYIQHQNRCIFQFPIVFRRYVQVYLRCWIVTQSKLLVYFFIYILFFQSTLFTTSLNLALLRTSCSKVLHTYNFKSIRKWKVSIFETWERFIISENVCSM